MHSCRLDRCDQPIATGRQCLNVFGVLRMIAQSVADLANGVAQSLLAAIPRHSQ